MANKIATFIFIVLLPVVSWSQPQQGIPLKAALDSLEIRFNVKFSFADNDINNVTITANFACNDLNACLEIIERNTSLKFEVLSDRFIAIVSNQPDEQSLCGVISDAKSLEVLENAIIRIKNGSYFSDSSGHFQIENYQVSDTITIHYFGYLTKSITVGDLRDNNCIDIRLMPSVTILDVITIENFIVRGIDKKFDGSIKVNIPDAGILPGLIEPDVLFTIQKLPGIQSTNETVSDINVRGGSNDQNLVLWDGIKMYKTGHFFGLISAFNPYLTSDVTLIKNGTSSRHFEGVSSIIDIQTYDDVQSEMEVGMGLNMLNGDMYLKVPLTKKLSFNTSARRSLGDIISSPTYNNYFDRAFRDSEVAESINQTNNLSTQGNFNFYDFSGKLLYDFNKNNQFRFSFLKISNEISFSESGLIDNSVESKNSRLGQSNIAGSAKYHKTWSDKTKSSLALNISSYDLTSINYDVLNNQRLFQENDVLDIELQSNLNFKISEQFLLATGYEYNEIGITNKDELNAPNFKQIVKEVLHIHGQFTELSYTSDKGNTIGRFGIRINYFDEFDKWRLEPRFALNRLLTDYITLELLGEMKSQVTTQVIDFQTDFLGVEKRRWVLVNDSDIPIITSRQLSLGAHYNKKGLIMGLEGYLKKVGGIITSSQGFQNQFEFTRTDGVYTSMGIDVLVNRQFKNINAWVNYSLANNVYEFNELTPSRFSNNVDLRHILNVGVSFQYNTLEVSAGINYHTGRPVTEPSNENPIIENQINYQPPNSTRIGSYIRPDFSIKYSFDMGNKTNIQIGGSLWNFIDQENIINRYYTIIGDDQVQKVEEMALGITPNVMMRVTLK